MKNTFKQSALGRVLAGAATAFLALGMVAVAPVAHAQSGSLSLSNPSSCSTFSGFTWNGSSLSVTCTSQVIQTCDTTQPGSFSWVASSGSATVGGFVAGTIQRVGGCKGQYTITFGTNGSTFPGVSVNPATSVSFADGSATSQQVTVQSSSATPAGTSVAIWLNGFSSSTASSAPAISGTFTATFAAAPPATGGNPVPVAGCSTTANYNVALNSATQIFMGTFGESGSLPPLKQGESIAVSFTYADNGSWGEVDLSQVTNPAAGSTVDTEVSLDPCPGNFPATTADTACDKRLTYPATGGPVLYGFTNASNFGMCALTPGNKYYLNLRNVQANYNSPTGTPSCGNSGGCALRFRGINFN